jgi:hypothetical protein
VDFSKMSMHREGLQSALDSTILAAATGKFGPLANMDKTAAKNYLNSVAAASGLNIDEGKLKFEIGRVADKAASSSQSSAKKEEEKFMVWGTASAPVETYFLNIFNSMLGTDTANASSAGLNKVGVYSEAFASTRKNLEIVLVLDNTGSMGSRNKMGILKQATLNFVDEIEGLTKYNKTNWVKMGLVPFTTQVRFDASYKNDGWVGFEDKDHKNGWSGCLWRRERTRAPRCPAGRATPRWCARHGPARLPGNRRRRRIARGNARLARRFPHPSPHGATPPVPPPR